MVRSKKRKNAGVGIDFRRAKRRVGRSLPKSTHNATDTTIRSRSIHVPGQSVAVDRESAAVSKRQLSLKELLQQTVHYRGRVRRDAFVGLMELLTDHPSEMKGHLSQVVHAVAEAMMDRDGNVRGASHRLMEKLLLPKPEEEEIRPFLSVMMTHVCCAMTSMDEGIKRDGLKALQSIVKFHGRAVAALCLDKCLKQFVHLLGNERLLQKLETQSRKKLNQILTTLNDVLSYGQQISSFESYPALRPDDITSSNQFGDNSSQALFSVPVGSVASSGAELHGPLLRLMADLKDIFESCLMLLGTSGNDSDTFINRKNLAAAVTAVLLISERLSVQEESLPSSQKQTWRALLHGVCSRLGDQFPWASEASDHPDTCKLIGSFNLTAAMLLVRDMTCVSDATNAGYEQSVVQFYTCVMDEALNHVTATNCEAVIMIVPQIAVLLRDSRMSEKHILFSKLLACCDAFHRKPVPQLRCLQFLLSILHRQFTQRGNEVTVCDTNVQEVICYLPKWLWQAGAKSSKNLQVCLRILHLLLKSSTVETESRFTKIHRQILLVLIIPCRNQETGNVAYGVGPIIRCPEDSQQLLLDCLFYFPISVEPVLDVSSLRFIVRNEKFSAGFVSELLFVVLDRLQRSEASEAKTTYVQTLAKLLLHDTKARTSDCDAKARERLDTLAAAGIDLVVSIMENPQLFVMELMEDMQRCLTIDAGAYSFLYGVLCLASKVLSISSRHAPEVDQSRFEQTIANLLQMHTFRFMESVPRCVHQGEDSDQFSALLQSPCRALTLLHQLCTAHTSILPPLLWSIRRTVTSAADQNNPFHKTSVILVFLLRDKRLNKQWEELRDIVLDITSVLQEGYKQSEHIPALFHTLKAIVQHRFLT